MQPHLVRIMLAAAVTVPLLGCHGRSGDGGGLVNVRTRNGVHVRAPFVDVHVPEGDSEAVDAGPAPAPLPPPMEVTPLE